jgi:hypothetical protein
MSTVSLSGENHYVDGNGNVNDCDDDYEDAN